MPLIFRGLTLMLLIYRMYRRLPPSQRRRLLRAAGKHGPRIASTAARRARQARALR